MYEFLNQGWVGSAIGLLGLVVGVIGLVFYFRSKIGARPACQMRSLRLIGKEEQKLPREVKILFKDAYVPRLTLTRIWIWNCGTETIRGSQIVEDDALRCTIDTEARILSANVAAVTRAVNKFTVTVEPNKPNVAVLGFDYLDPNDGARIEVLHTCKKRYPGIAGTIRGIPKGIKDFTPSPVPHAVDRAFDMVFRSRNIVYSVAAVLGAVALIAGCLPEAWLQILREAFKAHKEPEAGMRGFRFALITVGSLYTFIPLSRILARRKKYPALLDIDADREIQPNKASDATSEPAPSAASSAHQG